MLEFYTIYKITNLINNKIYIGAHRTTNPMDNYFGSGDEIILAIKKYGKENFKKEILGFHENEDLMYLEEAKIVDQDFINRQDTYNIVLGGGKPPLSRGEQNGFFGKEHTDITKKILSDKQKIKGIRPPSRKGSTPWNKNLTKDTDKRVDSISKKLANKKASTTTIETLRYSHIKQSRRVQCIETQEIFDTIEEAKRKLNINSWNISRCARGLLQTAGGFTWKFI